MDGKRLRRVGWMHLIDGRMGAMFNHDWTLDARMGMLNLHLVLYLSPAFLCFDIWE